MQRLVFTLASISLIVLTNLLVKDQYQEIAKFKNVLLSIGTYFLYWETYNLLSRIQDSFI